MIFNIVHRKLVSAVLLLLCCSGLLYAQRSQDIVYLEASDNYTNIFMTTGKKLLVSRTLKIFEELLPPETFLRIHHGYIVNKFQVEKYIRGEGGQVVMRNGAVLDVSKRKKSMFLQAIHQ